MPQSPVYITGLSGDGTASVYLGGLKRDIQVAVQFTSTAVSSAIAGSVHVAISETPFVGGTDIYTLNNPSPGSFYQPLTVTTAFCAYLNVYTASVSSEFFDSFNVHLYFDGPQWPSS
jgi:hypothetical protein